MTHILPFRRSYQPTHRHIFTSTARIILRTSHLKGIFVPCVSTMVHVYASPLTLGVRKQQIVLCKRRRASLSNFLFWLKRKKASNSFQLYGTSYLFVSFEPLGVLRLYDL